MASPDIVDLENILKPISDEAPTGEDIRENRSPSSPYQTIKIERNAARAAERSSVHEGDSNDADNHWRKILELAPGILINESKDLEVASWYTEALIRRHGFQGLRDGFRIIHGLIENFWDELYPMPDEDGIETRVSSLAGLNGEGAEGVLIAPIRKVEITEGQPPAPFSYWQYQQALDIQKTADEEARENKRQNLGFDIEDIEKAVNESSEEFFVNQRDDAAECIDIYKKAGQLLDEHCGTYDAPSISNITGVLDECLGAIKHLGKLKFPSEDVAEVDGAEDETGSNESGGATQTVVVQKGPIANREDAFKQLLEISEFFRKTEPHSPVSYVLEKAVKWGNMQLNELMSELIQDSSALERYSELTGVKTEE